MTDQVRTGSASEFAALAELWHRGWHEAHSAIVPPALTRLRTLASFRQWLSNRGDSLRVLGPLGTPKGFAILRKDELYQIFVDDSARGSGIASALMRDAEKRMWASGHRRAWLDCAVGNARAAAFYRKCGWQLSGTVTTRLDTCQGGFDLEVWRFDKAL
ncbi:MAG: GNAT family N-acetyltransferase [Pseudomonadota bacterium]